MEGRRLASILLGPGDDIRLCFFDFGGVALLFGPNVLGRGALGLTAMKGSDWRLRFDLRSPAGS